MRAELRRNPSSSSIAPCCFEFDKAGIEAGVAHLAAHVDVGVRVCGRRHDLVDRIAHHRPRRGKERPVSWSYVGALAMPKSLRNSCGGSEKSSPELLMR